MRISTNLRKWISLIVAVIVYYIVHEGAHLIAALLYGSFEKIQFLGLGVQVVINATAMSNLQLAVFCVVGSLAALAAAYILVLCADRICSLQSRYIKAIGYYTTLAMLLIDSVYLSVLYRFFGGGDMNGIKLFGIHEAYIQLIYTVIAIINVVIAVKYVYPKYKEAFGG